MSQQPNPSQSPETEPTTPLNPSTTTTDPSIVQETGDIPPKPLDQPIETEPSAA